MPQKKEFPGWTLFVILFIITVLPFFFFSPQARQTSYSDFKRLVREGKIKEVVISRDTIEGVKVETPGKEEPFSTVRVEDPNLISELDNQNIKITGEVQSGWLKDVVLFWVLPAAVMMVAAHNNDLVRAASHGMKTAFISRPYEHGAKQSRDFKAERDFTHAANGFEDLADQLGA